MIFVFWLYFQIFHSFYSPGITLMKISLNCIPNRWIKQYISFDSGNGVALNRSGMGGY